MLVGLWLMMVHFDWMRTGVGMRVTILFALILGVFDHSLFISIFYLETTLMGDPFL